MPLPGGSCGSSGSSGLSPGSDSDGGSPTSRVVDSMLDGGHGVGGCMGGGGSLGGTLRGVLSRYWSLESLHSTTGKCSAQIIQVCAELLQNQQISKCILQLEISSPFCAHGMHEFTVCDHACTPVD